MSSSKQASTFLPGVRRLHVLPIPGKLVLTIAFLFSSSVAQVTSDASSLAGTVRDSHGTPVPHATITLQSANPSQTFTSHTDPEGKYRFAAISQGVYALHTEASGFAEASVPAVFLGPKESKSVDLTLQPASTSAAPNASPMPQPHFFDEPQFTVAGVTDASNLGGHGSDVVVRTRDTLARETASLAATRNNSAAPESLAIERSLRETADRNPKDFDANHRLGELLLNTARAQQSMPYLERAASVRSDDYQNNYDIALANTQAGNYVSARSRVLELLVAHDKAELHHLLGDIEEKRGNPLEAVRQYQRAAEMLPTESYYFDWGAELLLHHAPEPAFQVFTKGAQLFPRSERLLIGTGAALFAHGSYDDAVLRLCEASDLNPGDPAPYIFLGRMQPAENASVPRAVDTLHRFVTLHPDSAEANYYYAVALSKSRKDPGEKYASDVQSFLLKAASLDPKFAAPELQLGIIEAQRGNYDTAASRYERALKIDPQMEEAHYRLAQAYRQLGKADRVKEELRSYDECVKQSHQRNEQERHEIRQFVYTLRDQRPSNSSGTELPK
jgi:tetratricopeptide (TPR) repeat protein